MKDSRQKVVPSSIHKIRWSQLGEFVQVYVLDWHVMSALLVPMLFGLLFPLYWFVICPHIWTANPSLFRPRSWLIAYWLFASMVWFVFLAICLYHMRSGHQTALRGRFPGLRSSDSTEDIWNEDKYIPEAYLPAPEYLVSISAVQPNVDLESHLEAKQEMDETWDYNYDEQPGKHLPQDQMHTLSKVKRKFSNFMIASNVTSGNGNSSCNGNNKGNDNFDLSTDEEDEFGSEVFRQAPTGPAAAMILAAGGEKYFLKSIQKSYGSVGKTSGVNQEQSGVNKIQIKTNSVASTDPDLGMKSERSDSVVSDAKFDLILASLQNLATEIERDFKSNDNT